MGKHMCILPLSYISEAANLLWQPEGSPRRIVSPVISSTTQPALLLALPPRPWPPCCDTLPPLDAHHLLCSQAGCRRSYVLADDKALCRLLLPTCRPWKPTPDRCIGGRRERQEAGKLGKQALQPAIKPPSQAKLCFFSFPSVLAPAPASSCHMKGEIEPEPRARIE